MFPMMSLCGERDEQCVAHWITSPMGWGCRDPALNSRMKPSAVKAGGTGEAPPFRAGQVTFWVIGLLLLVSTASNTTLPPFCKQVDDVVVCWLDEGIDTNVNATVMTNNSATATPTTSTLVHEATIALAVVVAVAHLLKNKGA